MDKIVRVALATKFGDNVDGIIEVINNTPNVEHAVELLLGIYEEPIFKALHTYTYRYNGKVKGEEFKNLNAAWHGYNPWTRTLSVTVSRPITREIGILKEFDEIVNKDNYTEYALTNAVLNKTDRELWRWKTIVLDEKENVIEFIEDGKSIIEWYETELDMEC
jgi:hypothetical protein